jgi:nitrogen fixation NifU-like protein
MDSLYKEIVLDHYKNPHNFGTLDPADYTAEDSNPLCGDQVRMDLRVEDGIVTDVKFSA